MSVNQKLRVGLVLDDTIDSSDGVQQFVLTLGKWLENQGHSVFYLTGESYRKDLSNLYSLSRNVHIRFNGNRFSIPLPASKKTINEILGSKFDILHIQMPYSPMLAGRIVKYADASTAVIGTFHIAPYGKFASIAAQALGLLSKTTITRFDKVIAVSLTADEMARNMYKVKPIIIGNMFNYKKFSEAKPYDRQATVELLFLGRLVKRKGCITLLEALSIIQRSTTGMPKVRLTIVGDGPLKTHLEEYVAKKGLNDWVRFIGFINEADKPRYLASADISVFPSISGESFGFVLLEAMSSGKSAIIAADNPGYKTLLKYNQDMLFPAGDAISLASKIKEFIYDEALRYKIALAGRIIAKTYDQEVIGPAINEEYRRALHRRRA